MDDFESLQILSSLGRVADQVQPLNLAAKSAEDQSSGGITHPRVELAVWLCRSQCGIVVKEASRLDILVISDNISRQRKLPSTTTAVGGLGNSRINLSVP